MFFVQGITKVTLLALGRCHNCLIAFSLRYPYGNYRVRLPGEEKVSAIFLRFGSGSTGCGRKDRLLGYAGGHLCRRSLHHHFFALAHRNSRSDRAEEQKPRDQHHREGSYIPSWSRNGSAVCRIRQFRWRVLSQNPAGSAGAIGHAEHRITFNSSLCDSRSTCRLGQIGIAMNSGRRKGRKADCNIFRPFFRG